MVKTKYLDSQFMKRPNAENVSQAIRSSLNTHAIPSQEMIHASMDGPHTWRSLLSGLLIVQLGSPSWGRATSNMG